MNATFQTRKNKQAKSSQNDVKFKNFCQQNLLQVSPKTPDEPTYCHIDKVTQYALDLFVQRSSEHTINKIFVSSKSPLNTSSHHPVTAEVCIAITEKQAVPTSQQGNRRIILDSEKVNKPFYTQLTTHCTPK